MQQIHSLLSLKQAAKAMKLCLGPMRGYYCLDLNTPPPRGVKASLSEAAMQFKQGNQARHISDKQFGLNKAFTYKGRATTGYLSCPWPACYPCDTSLTFIHHG